MDVCGGIDRAKTCCFTGHRLKDLPFGGDRHALGMRNLVSTLYLTITETVKEGYDTFISGMSDGIDLICADIVCQMISKGEKLDLICAVPYAGQIREMRSPRSAYLYEALTSRFPTVVLSRNYHPDCYKERNQFMVDHSSKLIGVYRHKSRGSGTMQTIGMARRAGLSCRIIRLDSDNTFYFEYDKGENGK
ncbi:Uncharacterized SPBc2 prophage-derived protein YoqJ [Ruminococcaceae bacterium FB2012]|nr:Uncharacterized SPBc2 prophage-derived protein YoqJ [Ruminococcaceae bacterium FB2012]